VGGQRAGVIPGHWQAVARGDGETVGYVASSDGEHVAYDLLGHALGRGTRDDEARGLVVERGLAGLTGYWDWTDDSGETRRVHVVHVRPGRATVRTGFAGVVGAQGETYEVELPVDPAGFRPA